MARGRYFLIRTVQTVFLLWLILTVLFIFFRLMPGSYTDIMLYQGASQEAVQQFRDQWGLNDPLYIQYIDFLWNYLTLDAGTSIKFRKPVVQFVGPKIFNSFILIAPAITSAYILGALLGLLSGTVRGTKLEQLVLVPTILYGSTPSFVIAVFAVVVFAGILGWVPTSGMLSVETWIRTSEMAWWQKYLTYDFLRHWILPFTVITLRYLLVPSLVMRTSLVEILGQDFIFYKKVTGIPKTNRLFHLAKHASLPVITLYPVSMTRAIGGLVLVEVVFNWPGIGSTLVSSVFARDVPVIQFVFFVIAAMVIIANFGIDILYGYIDPRVSVEAEEG